MAEGLAKKLLDGDYEILSRGLSVSYSQPANPKSLLAMATEGVDLSGHVSRRFDPSEVTEKTLVLGMTQNHVDYLMAYYPELKGRVDTLLSIVGLPGEVSDPYGSGQEIYIQCAKLLKKAIIKLKDIL